MSGRTVTHYVLICDGCDREMPEADTAIEARAAAYASGWRFPARVKGDGKPSLESSDVCSGCIARWEPRPATNQRGKNVRRRPAS